VIVAALIAITAVVLIAVGVFVVMRKAGGGRFPWLQFYLKGREAGFIFREINLLRRVAVEARLENPTSLFWSVKQLDRSIKGTIIKARSLNREQDPENQVLLSKLFELRGKVEFDLPKYKLGIKSSRKLLKNQRVRVALAGIGTFHSMIVENLNRYMAMSHPEGPKLPEGFSWKNQKIGVSFWRAEDAGYSFQSKVLEDFADRQYPILHVTHSENMVRNQKRSSVRVDTDMAAELYPLKTIAEANENQEAARGLRSRLADLSEGGAAVIIGGRAKAGLPVKVQFSLGDKVLALCGVVKNAAYDEKKNRSVLHIQASPPSSWVRNRILTYVYNLFGERDEKPAAPQANPGEPPGPPPTIELK
jgi:c-di-GMP-binding flagellar brake protein YcgR